MTIFYAIGFVAASAGLIFFAIQLVRFYFDCIGPQITPADIDDYVMARRKFQKHLAKPEAMQEKQTEYTIRQKDIDIIVKYLGIELYAKSIIPSINHEIEAGIKQVLLDLLKRYGVTL